MLGVGTVIIARPAEILNRIVAEFESRVRIPQTGPGAHVVLANMLVEVNRRDFVIFVQACRTRQIQIPLDILFEVFLRPTPLRCTKLIAFVVIAAGLPAIAEQHAKIEIVGHLEGVSETNTVGVWLNGISNFRIRRARGIQRSPHLARRVGRAGDQLDSSRLGIGRGEPRGIEGIRRLPGISQRPAGNLEKVVRQFVVIFALHFHVGEGLVREVPRLDVDRRASEVSKQIGSIGFRHVDCLNRRSREKIQLDRLAVRDCRGNLRSIEGRANVAVGQSPDHRELAADNVCAGHLG